MVMEQESLEVVQGEVVESTVAEVVVPAGVLAGTRREGLGLKGVTIPFVGETPTGGERTKFLPRSSKDFFKPFLKTHYNTIKQLSVDYLPVNLYSVPQPRSRTKCSRSDSSRPGQIWSRSSHKARTRVESDNRRLRNSPSHQRSQAPTDRQATSKMSLPDGAGREESGPSYRRGHKGSSLLMFSVNFTNLPQHRSCYT